MDIAKTRENSMFPTVRSKSLLELTFETTVRSKSLLELAFEATVPSALKITVRPRFQGHCALEITARARFRDHRALKISARAHFRGTVRSKSLLEHAYLFFGCAETLKIQSFETTVHCALEITARTCLCFLRMH